jgi:hypothetical protein
MARWPEAAHADHDRGGVGSEHGQGLLDCVVGRQAGVGERGGIHGIELVERHQIAGGGHEHELGHAPVTSLAVAARFELPDALAHVLGTDPAGLAPAAPPRAIDRHRVPLAHSCHSGAGGLDPARVLVSQRERGLPGQRTRGELHDVQVGVARAGRGHTQENLPRPRLGDRHVAQHRRLLPFDQLIRQHRRFVPGVVGYA